MPAARFELFDKHFRDTGAAADDHDFCVRRMLQPPCAAVTVLESDVFVPHFAKAAAGNLCEIALAFHRIDPA